jgi:hypothetical protein
LERNLLKIKNNYLNNYLYFANLHVETKSEKITEK